MKRIVSIIALTLVMVIALTSCSVVNRVKDFVTGIINPDVELTDATLNAETLIDFEKGANPDVLFESDGWSNGDVFNVVWKSHNVHYENGIMRLGITEEKATAWIDGADVEYQYTAGEARTQNYYHYGDYEVYMKPSANPGTASTFFVCTGPYDLKDGVPNAHDEIDIEFLGNDTTHVQFNFFVDGIGAGVNEYMYDLGFDASEDFHRYGFRWLSDSITWFVDGVPVYKVTTDTSVKEGGNLKVVEKLPSTAGRILTNYWCGNERAWGWMGTYVGNAKDQGTEYKWIKTSAEGAPLNPSDEPTPVLPTPDPECENGCYICGKCLSTTDACTDKCAGHVVAPEGEVAQLGEFWTSNDSYTVEGTKIKYSGLGNSFACAGVPVADLAAGKNTFTLTLTNNGAAVALVRVDVQGTTQVGNHAVINTSAKVGDIDIGVDTLWGGSKLEIAPGQSVTLVITYDESTDRGAVTNLVFFVDSGRGNGETYNSDITISNVTFTQNGEIVTPDPKPDPDPNPDTGLKPTFYPEANTGYEVNGLNIKYNGAGNTYKPVTANGIGSHTLGKNTLTLTVTNNGAADSRVRVDLQGTTRVSTGEESGTDACNLSSVGADSWTDTTWGGTAFTVPAGQSVTITITYTNYGAQGLVQNLLVFVDSARGDGATYTSDITLSGIEFGGEETAPADPTPNPDPKPDPTPEIPEGEYLNYKGNDIYAFDAAADAYVNKVVVTYTNAETDTYLNVNTWIQDKAAGKATMSLYLTNNGEADVTILVKLQTTAEVSCGEKTVTIAAGETQQVEIAYTLAPDQLYFFIATGWNNKTFVQSSGVVTIAGVEFK